MLACAVADVSGGHADQTENLLLNKLSAAFLGSPRHHLHETTFSLQFVPGLPLGVSDFAALHRPDLRIRCAVSGADTVCPAARPAESALRVWKAST
eukprot:407096-Rhodomonas_salina.1